MTPMMRHLRRQPGKAGSSISTSTSVGSPSSALVDGMKPKSYGKVIPVGKTLVRAKTLSSSSNAYLFRLPLGVSMMTWIFPSPSVDKRLAGSASDPGRPVFFAISIPSFPSGGRSAHVPNPVQTNDDVEFCQCLRLHVAFSGRVPIQLDRAQDPEFVGRASNERVDGINFSGLSAQLHF